MISDPATFQSWLDQRTQRERDRPIDPPASKVKQLPDRADLAFHEYENKLGASSTVTDDGITAAALAQQIRDAATVPPTPTEAFRADRVINAVLGQAPPLIIDAAPPPSALPAADPGAASSGL